ncbi:MAG: hypothetical protein H0T89_03655 [Deltaproteobacteria bacterium]|nr:hypothetical protein [Deltaproteobacteria bacterium]MDQ3301277.1 hypothetical protein [Myxococcota bacterium]
MARLGELLVAAGTLSAEQVEQALRAQVMWGGRLGTNIIELGYLDLDKLAQALGRQHKLPAALGRHFDRGDAALQRQLSADVAERFGCVPLLYGGRDRTQIIIAALAPLDARATAIIADELAVTPAQIVVSIAAELRIKYHLERVYKIPRGTRFLRSRGKTIPPFPQFDIDPLAFEDSQVDMPLPTDSGVLVALPRPTTGPLAEPVAAATAAPLEDLDGDLEITGAHVNLGARLPARAADAIAADPADAVPAEVADSGTAPLVDDDMLEIFVEEDGAVPQPVAVAESTGRERRRYVRTIDDEPSTDSERETERERQAALGRISIRRVTASVTAAAEAALAMVEAEVAVGQTLGEATRAIRRSLDRDRVADLVIETLFRFSMSCEAAIMLVVRGDAAMSWKGFCRSGAPLAEIAIPMDQPGMVPRVVTNNVTARIPSTDLGPIDQLLLVSLGQQAGDLVVVPISIAGQVMCVIAMVTVPDASTSSAESIAAAAGAAFARLMRNASR